MTAENVNILIQELSNNNELMRQLLNEMKFQRKEWYTPDEAANKLGLQITESGSHRRKLKELRDRGLLSIFGQTRPYTYSSKEVASIARKVHKAELII